MGILEDKARARTFYRYLSRVYDSINPLVWNEEMREEAIGLLELDADDRVLDVGCGTGFATAGLLEHTRTVHGLDQSVHQLQQAWQKLGKHEPVAFALGDAERLPYRDGTFDVVWSSGAIEYWPRPVETLRELRRVVTADGTVLVVGPLAPRNRLLRGLADGIMLFYDEPTADRMFRDAGYATAEHRVLRAGRWRPGAIVSRAIPSD